MMKVEEACGGLGPAATARVSIVELFKRVMSYLCKVV